MKLDSTYAMTDHDKYEWIRVGDLLNWDLAPADIPIAEALVANDLNMVR